MKPLYLSLLLFAIPFQLFSQKEQLSEAIRELDTLIFEVIAGNISYKQSISFDTLKPYNININVIENGRREILRKQYQFNLADINPQLISWKPKKDLIHLRLGTQKKQKFISVFKNGVQIDYADELIVYPNSVANAREIAEKFEECIALARQLFNEEVEIKSFDEGIQWINNHFEDVRINDVIYRQSLIRIQKDRPVFEYMLGKEKKEIRNIFNMADLRGPTVKLEVKDNTVLVVAKTEQSKKYIQCEENGKRQNYSNKLTLYLASIQQGRLFRNVLEQTIQLSKEEMRITLPSIENCKEGTLILMKLIGEVKSKPIPVSQSVKGECRAILEKEEKGFEKYQFYWSDLDNNSLEIKVKGKYLSIEVETENKDPLIQYYKNNVLDNYQKSVSIEADDVESARTIEFVMRRIIELCKKERSFTFPEEASISQLCDWVIQQIKDVVINEKEYRQNLKIVNDLPCQLHLSITETSKKNSATDVYEFSLSDLDKRDIKYDIRGKELAISLEVTRKNDYIKHLKDNKTESYTNKFKFFLADLEVTRNVIEALKILVVSCRQNEIKD